MPALRTPKGKATGKGKAATRPRKHLKDNVDPCEICGVVVSRKSDVPRHAKTHASDAEKLPCTWEGCTFRTLQKSNLDTHYRRHTQDRSFNCTDDPECTFQTCDPASLLRHRKRLHGYTPRASVGYKDENPYKHVHVRVIRGVAAGDAGSVASQFITFSSGASTSSAPVSRLSPSDSLSPSSSPTSSPTSSRSASPSLSPPPSSSRLRPPPRSYSPANSSGESEVTPSSPSTPVASPSDRELTPEISSPTVLSMTSSPVYPTGKSLLFSDSLLLAHPKNYAWGLYLDPPLTPECSDISVGEEDQLKYQYAEEEINDQPVSVLDELDSLSLPFQWPGMEKIWAGYQTTGQLNGSGSSRLDIEQYQQRQPSSETAAAEEEEEFVNSITFGVSVNGSPFLECENLPVGFFPNSPSDLYDYSCRLEVPALGTVPIVLDASESGFECRSLVGSVHVQPGLSSTLDANAVTAHYHDMTSQTTFVDGSPSSFHSCLAGDNQIATDDDEPNLMNANNSDVQYGSNTSGDVSYVSSNHLNLSVWDILGLYMVWKEGLWI